MRQLTQNVLDVPSSSAPAPAQDNDIGPPVFLELLWRRKWTIVLCVMVALAGAAAYLWQATPIYRSSVRVQVEQSAPQVNKDPDHIEPVSESFLQTQVDAMRSSAVISRMLQSLDWRGMKAFAGVTGDPVEWLKKSDRLDVSVVKKSNLLDVSMESPVPAEAAAIATAVVNAYSEVQFQQRNTQGHDMLEALKQEKTKIDERRQALMKQIIEEQRKQGVASFGDDKGNTVLEKIATLSKALDAAQLASIDLRTRRNAVITTLQNPQTGPALVTSELLKTRAFSDREYDELRTQITATETALSMTKVNQGANNRQVVLLQARLDSLHKQLADKERNVAQAHVAGLTTELAASEAKEAEIRTALNAQQNAAADLRTAKSQYGQLSSELDSLQKQSDQLQGRMVEISVNSQKSWPGNIRVTEAAHIERDPVKPQKKLVLLGALLAGLVIGTGAAMLREWQDVSVRTPEELASFGWPVLAIVPRMNTRLSPLARGRVVGLDPRSPVAEAFRSLRTSLRIRSAWENRKIILVTSAIPGDGKSTTASNLAIAFAMAGESTLIMDCDLRKPVQHLIFETKNDVGLSDLLTGQITRVTDALRRTQNRLLFVLPCGALPEHPSELLGGKRFARLLKMLSTTFDRIIIDSPPVMTVTDAHILAGQVDATLLVLRMNHSARPLVAHAREVLGRIGANVVGAVANDAPLVDPYGYYGLPWKKSVNGNGHLLGVANNPAIQKENSSRPSEAEAQVG